MFSANVFSEFYFGFSFLAELFKNNFNMLRKIFNLTVSKVKNDSGIIRLMGQETIADRIQRGDRQAFRDFTEKYYPLVLRSIMGFVHNEEDAKDLSQEVFIELYQSIDKFRKESQLSTWIYRIAVNKSLNYIRNKKRLQIWQNIGNIFSLPPNTASASYEASDDVRSIESRERSGVIHQAMDALPKNQKIAFTLSKYDELSNKEIAEIMDVSVSAVESLVHRAKLNLQKKLIGYFEKKVEVERKKR